MKDYMCEKGGSRGSGLEQARRDCLEQGEVEPFLLCPSPGGVLLEGARCQR